MTIQEIIKRELDASDLSKREIAKRLGISYQALFQSIKRDKPYITTILAISRVTKRNILAKIEKEATIH